MRMSNFGLWKSANAVVVMFDVTSRVSFASCENWLQAVKASIDANAYIVLVGNKVDREEDRMVDKEEAEKFAFTHDMEYFETSAATQHGVEELFFEIVTVLLEKAQAQEGLKRTQNKS